ncbi:universal stress protein (plasmid) [Halorussus salilacus]|uniref:universal stress protein n=1 Tax=Halorussus salilacus TaxID=2953750 RepID=UPI0020A1F2B9|nr:universal stress protein [Halorussus salilacus]USZ69807.1 universal stress protein [Halorussus salilacus]
MYERILVPTDGSDAVDPAVDHAIDLAKTYDAELHALNAVNVGTLSSDHQSSVVDRLEKAGADATDAVAERAADAGLANVTTAVVRERPAAAILDYAEREGVDLVVMGTHGRSGMDRHLIGSVTEKVVRQSDVPVLSVCSDADGDSKAREE